MGQLKCTACGHEWDGSRTPCCPKCIAKMWVENPNFIRDDHNPDNMPILTTKVVNSIVTHDVIKNLSDAAFFIASNGDWHRNEKYDTYGVYAQKPTAAQYPASGLNAQGMAAYGLDGLLVAQANDIKCNHGYGKDNTDYKMEEGFGRTSPLIKCVVKDCPNLQNFRSDFCLLHDKRDPGKVSLP
jgi:hypothetical protein